MYSFSVNMALFLVFEVAEQLRVSGVGKGCYAGRSQVFFSLLLVGAINGFIAPVKYENKIFHRAYYFT